MLITEYQKRVSDWLMANPMSNEIANILAELILEASEDCDFDFDKLNQIEEKVFGKRVECPKCGSLALPEMVCWGCDEWTAPKPLTNPQR